MTLSFVKYEGLGNDFIVLDGDAGITPELASRLCDRNFGVGADGVLLVLPPSTPGAAARMLVLNADGSRPEMCGNGLRCVAVHVARGAASSFVVDTDAGPLGCEVDGHQVSIGMGKAVDLGPLTVNAAGASVTVHRVSTGNPHAITFEDLGPGAFERLGPALATHKAFPQGTNVELARMRGDGGVDLRVWERGVGPTLACGTGACAVAALAAITARAPFAEPIAIHLPGGRLDITVTRGLEITMRGPARRVFSGTVSGALSP